MTETATIAPTAASIVEFVLACGRGTSGRIILSLAQEEQLRAMALPSAPSAPRARACAAADGAGNVAEPSLLAAAEQVVSADDDQVLEQQHIDLLRAACKRERLAAHQPVRA